jgi:hypothetical protein
VTEHNHILQHEQWAAPPLVLATVGLNKLTVKRSAMYNREQLN